MPCRSHLPPTPQVADFGESRQYDSARSKEEQRSDLTMTQVGTYLYLAPEVLEGKRYNKSVDVFAYALILLEIALSNAGYVKKLIASKYAYVEGWRPPIPSYLEDEQPKLASVHHAIIFKK